MNPLPHLEIEDFTKFVKQVHGHEPFPWQTRLLKKIAQERRWPDALDIPTGLGKTSVLDIAVFLAALDRDLAPRRVFLVADRRLIVDQAHEHATRLAHVLSNEADSPCSRVAARLRVAGDDGPVLDVTRMRGGTTWSAQWLERPDRHAIVVGTLDQIGSRLLFRGYNITEYRRPIDAALVGTDSLIIIDEAHLAGPFIQTLQRIRAMDHPTGVRPPTVITMSATLAPTTATHTTATVFGLGTEDEHHPATVRRLHAAKRLHTVDVATKATADTMPQTFADWAVALTTPGIRHRADDVEFSPQLVGVVANTVARARAVHTTLTANHNAILLTGRIRPVDRSYLLARWLPAMRTGRTRTPGTPLFVVATQTIEVGADVDFDALVTEIASLPALVQRLGRLNRVGAIDPPGGGARAPIAVVLRDSSAKVAPVYGEAAATTWTWLTDHVAPVSYRPGQPVPVPQPVDGLDVSPSTLQRLLAGADLGAMTEPRRTAPLLVPSTLDTWARTSPPPHPDQPVAPYLHGFPNDDRPADDRPVVQVVWRHGIANMPGQADVEAVTGLPPSTQEAIELPLHAVRRWLRGQPAATVTDLDTEPPQDDDQTHGRHRPQPVIRYEGRENATVIEPDNLRPGDLIVVPAAYGGCDAWGWDPTSTEPVVDVADLADRRRGAVLRIGPTLEPLLHGSYQPWQDGDERREQLLETIKELGKLADGTDDDRPDPGPFRDALQPMRSLPTADTATWPLLGTLHALANADDLAVNAAPTTADETTDKQPYRVLLSTKASRFAEDTTAAGTSITGRAITLRRHQAAVRQRAEQIAGNLGMPTDIVQAVGIAASWHDEGKRDPRCQAMLHGGDHLRAELHADDPLAKSGMHPDNRAAFRRARIRAGYPEHLRHEALSAQIAAAHLAADHTHNLDTDLVLHLIASHHGRSRPLLPPVVDPNPTKIAVTINGTECTFTSEETVDWDAPRRFTELNARYGRWGLALLETVVRLADIWCSIRAEEA